MTVWTGEAAAERLKKTEEQNQQQEGSPKLLDRIRQAANNRAKLEAALQRELEGNRALGTQIQAMAERAAGGAQHVNDARGTASAIGEPCCIQILPDLR